MQRKSPKGFTLIELLIVIGILAILATAVVLVLNPAELFRQARDSQRISDLSTLKSALSLYLATVSNPALGTTINCYTHAAGVAANCDGRHVGTLVSNPLPAINGTGWVPVNFTTMPGGSPLAVLPVDPTNNVTYFYSYALNATSLTFEINANMESVRYSNTGSDDVESTDGGTSVDVYETGNAPGLNL